VNTDVINVFDVKGTLFFVQLWRSPLLLILLRLGKRTNV